jgi:hypothetical protein
MEKCAALSNLLKNQPDKLSFSLVKSGNSVFQRSQVKVAGIDELFTVDDIRKMLNKRFAWAKDSIDVFISNLKRNKEASIVVDKSMLSGIEKTAENTAVIVDMYEVDYNPVTMGASTQAIEKNFDAVEDFVSRLTFPDTTIGDIVVGPKEKVLKKNKFTPLRPDLPQDVSIPTRRKGILEIPEKSSSKTAHKDQCPRCGSKDFGWMPADFETAKCNKCGKTWKGKNPPLPSVSSSWRKLSELL